MWNWLERRITANPSDPIPRVLTIAGLVMSTVAWVYGGIAGLKHNLSSHCSWIMTIIHDGLCRNALSNKLIPCVSVLGGAVR